MSRTQPQRLTLNGLGSLVLEGTPARFEMDATYAPHGKRPPRHVLPGHDEHFTVLTGTPRVGLADGEHDLAAGATLSTSRGTAHRMWNPGEEPITVRWLSTPALRVAPFFEAMDRLHRENRAGLATRRCARCLPPRDGAPPPPSPVHSCGCLTVQCVRVDRLSWN